MESILCFVFILLTSLFHLSQCAITNCTSAPCDIKTCSNTATECNQICSATPCKTDCSSPAGCRASCPLGGCSKMHCNVAVGSPPGTSRCYLNCKENCKDMNCNAYICFPECAKDNCTLTCDGSGATPQCYARCYGKGCEINCKSESCEILCSGGSCKIKFGKKSSGFASCPGGKCSLVCAKGRTCGYINACPNCSGPVYVDDPFSTMKPPTSGPTSKPANQKTCSSAPCDIKTCSNTSVTCRQVCSATPCSTFCSSPAGCDARCPVGGCTKMACNIATKASTIQSRCYLNCKENCKDMNCNAYLCYPECAKDKCTLTCDGSGATPQCYARCYGKGCEINCKSESCEILCSGGSCKIKFGKKSSGYASCPGGKCSLVCAKGRTCGYNNACPNCTGPTYVDDPFATGGAGVVNAAFDIFLVTVMHSFILLFL